jgi:hypothetical protein
MWFNNFGNLAIQIEAHEKYSKYSRFSQQSVKAVCSSGLYYHVARGQSDVSEEHTASVLRVELQAHQDVTRKGGGYL